MIPTIVQNDLDLLNNLNTVNYNGNIKINTQSLYAEGNLHTSIGNVLTKINLDFKSKENKMKYYGYIETMQFNLGKLIRDTNVGLLNFKGKIEGTGLSINLIKTNVEGICDLFTYRNYEYHNLQINGLFQNKYIKCKINILDSNLQFKSDLLINWADSLPHYKFAGNLKYMNLQALNLSAKKIILSSDVNLNVDFKDIDDLIGKISLSNLKIQTTSNKYDCGDINIFAEKDNHSNKRIHIKSDFINGDISGYFQIKSLIKSVPQMFANFLPKTIIKLDSMKAKDSFQFSFKVNKIDSFLKIINNDLTGLDNTIVQGNYNTNSQKILFNILIPEIKYKGNKLKNTFLEVIGENKILKFRSGFSGVYLNDTNLILKDFLISSNTKNDSTIIGITSKSVNDLKNVDINFSCFSNNNSFQILLAPSNFVFKNNLWTINEKGKILYKNNSFTTEKVDIVNGEEKIELVNGNIENINSGLLVHFENIRLHNLYSLIDPTTKVEGLSEGYIHFKNVFTGININTSISVHNFKNSTDSIGLISALINYDSNQMVSFEVDSKNEKYKFKFTGDYNIKDKVNPLNAQAYFDKTNIHIIYYYLNDIFKDIYGETSGKLNIIGDLEKPILIGNLALHNAFFKMDFTNVNYFIDTGIFIFNNQGIKIDNIKIKDNHKNIGYVDGFLYNTGLRNFILDFKVSSDNIMVYDTYKKPNEYFYGTVFGQVNLSIKGKDDDLFFNMDLTTKNNTDIHILNINEKAQGSLDYIKFKKNEITNKTKNISKSKYTFDLNLQLNQFAKTQVVLDEISNDIINSVGTGNINVHLGTFEPLSMRGIYKIDNGTYNLSFQNLRRISFNLNPDENNYIEWTDKPFEGNLNVNAKYKIDRINLSDLVGNNFSNNVKNYKGSLFIVTQLKDKLNKPQISFKFEFPPEATIYSDNEFLQFLDKLQKNENEILKQVTLLIFFQSFAPVNSIAGNFNAQNYNYSIVGYNTLSQLVSKEINNIFSNYLYKLTKDKKLSFEFGTSFYSSKGLLSENSDNTSINSVDRSRSNIKLIVNILNDKIKLSVGNDFDFNVNGSADFKNNNYTFLPNANLEYIISKDKKLKAIVFYNNSVDYSNNSSLGIGNTNHKGIRLSYQKDFD